MTGFVCILDRSGASLDPRRAERLGELLACYGSAYHETPALDGLMAEGMHFTDAYAACPVCSPTRASITGAAS